ncbi:MAG TPA: helix-turn-helix domain-containing protein, partial [Acidimicrobiales bacterium]|nr:helix-turn-helix domain-containing protein [Acidimicrobiales bacterium]
PMGATDTVNKLLYTLREAAHALGVSRSMIYVLLAEGGLVARQQASFAESLGPTGQHLDLSPQHSTIDASVWR